MIRNFFKSVTIAAIRENNKNNKIFHRLLTRSLSVHNVNFTKINVKTNFQNETIELYVDSSSKPFEFPFIWLRDNCKCKSCFHDTSHSRTLNWEHFDVSIKPKSVQFDDASKSLKIAWNDNDIHESEYDFEWLKARNFSDEARGDYLKKYYRPEKKLWSKKDFQFEQFDFRELVESDLTLYKWLRCMAVNGTAIISNTPQEERSARVIADRVGFIRKTHYGEEFEVKAKEGTANVAYLSENLQIHTDLPYYAYVPGANLLHCLVQSKSQGAQNLLADGFYVAELMRKEFPQEYYLLSTVIVNWSDIGLEKETSSVPFHSIYRAPMFCFDYDNNLERINHSIPQRDSFFSVNVKVVREWYKALRKFVDLIHAEAVEFKTKEGTILCFDNTRLVHGRLEYKDTTTNQRHIVGIYLDWDELYSRYRTLQTKFEN